MKLSSIVFTALGLLSPLAVIVLGLWVLTADLPTIFNLNSKPAVLTAGYFLIVIGVGSIIGVAANAIKIATRKLF